MHKGPPRLTAIYRKRKVKGDKCIKLRREGDGRKGNGGKGVEGREWRGRKSRGTAQRTTIYMPLLESSSSSFGLLS